MRFILPCVAFITFALMLVAAPIPKSLKKSKKNDYEGIWEVNGSNTDGKPSSTAGAGKFWRIETDKFYYAMSTPEATGTSGTLSTPDENHQELKLYNGSTRCLLEIDGDQLTWVFASDKNDPLDTATPAHNRVIYTFTRNK